MMYKANFKLEVVTPLMMSSGEIIPNGGTYCKSKRNTNGTTTRIVMTKELKTVELRVPSIKGVMRWWFRAVHCVGNVSDLKKLEDEIFGSTEGGSKVRMKIEEPKLTIDEWSNSFWENYRCSKISGKNYPINGYQYLAYTNFVESTSGQKTAVREFIKPDSTFNLVITSLDKKAFESALISFWFALHFGGFGNRARRGFGKLQVSSVDISPTVSNGDILSNFKFHCSDELEKHKEIITNGIAGWKTYRNGKGLSNTAITTYSNIMKAMLFYVEDKANFDCKEVLDKTPHTTWQLALNEAGKRFQYFRQEGSPDKGEILKKNKIQICKLKKPVFGLPIGYRFKNGYKTKVERKEDKNKGIGDRFASPLWISVHKIGKYYYPAFLFMFSNPAQDMEVTANGQNGNFKKNNDILNEFIKAQLSTTKPIEFSI